MFNPQDHIDSQDYQYIHEVDPRFANYVCDVFEQLLEQQEYLNQAQGEYKALKALKASGVVSNDQYQEAYEAAISQQYLVDELTCHYNNLVTHWNDVDNDVDTY